MHSPTGSTSSLASSRANLRANLELLRSWRIFFLSVALLTTALLLDRGSPASGPAAEPAFGALALGAGRILGTSLIPKIGQTLGRVFATGGARAGVTRAVPAVTRNPSTLRRLGVRTAGIGAAGLAFEGGTRLLPGGASFPGGDISVSGSPTAVMGGNVDGFRVGAQFGDTFITRIWTSGETREGVPIVHGLLANGKRFTTNRFGAIKVFRPKKSIVIGSDPKLSDATKVARAAKKMTKAAEQILEVSGKKAVRR